MAAEPIPDKAVVEDVHEDEEEEDEDVPELEGNKENKEDNAEEEGGRGQSRAEKKSRKALSKLGLKKVDGITRFSVIKARQTLFVVNKPDVYKSPHSDQYVIFGEAKVEDMSAAAQNAAANQFKAKEPAAGEGTEAAKEAKEEEEEEGEEDATGLKEKDIELVMEQGDCSRNKAIRALKKNNGDVVNAIMALTL
mmetsp:Transcript_5635/g.10056  ORF Transcript_5635/g.10056 Transcript_5635/m.10056 type:complete len:194 (+) Transcript_5635:77-658(+)|eukprot:CAMPEP_0184692646 /NCGR_PEP_ID=MMETSP0313-20130426/1036_1 /TAXON_ID=2792 /ORGANISM="Porphyridium aerugineum, Strain SAG 1380-2" /LENGTH=193 /DNA_ID=CAMNT_0027150489 /DNA_START=72 /DNA_END=653 /DNA_ORIENTATION=-